MEHRRGVALAEGNGEHLQRRERADRIMPVVKCFPARGRDDGGRAIAADDSIADINSAISS